MRKPSEEGKIWEWRAFGKLPPELLSAVNSLPIRDGMIGRPDNDTYLTTPATEHNIKLREISGHLVLKLKLLLDSGITQEKVMLALSAGGA